MVALALNVYAHVMSVYFYQLTHGVSKSFSYAQQILWRTKETAGKMMIKANIINIGFNTLHNILFMKSPHPKDNQK